MRRRSKPATTVVVRFPLATGRQAAFLSEVEQSPPMSTPTLCDGQLLFSTHSVLERRLCETVSWLGMSVLVA